MSVALVTRSSSRVEHLGIWAPDRSSETGYTTGRYVPVCGQERDHSSRWHIVESPHWDGGDQQRRKRLCSRCAQALADMVHLSEVRCRVCGCTQENGCIPYCWWVEYDPDLRRGLCSGCATTDPEDAP